MQNRLGIIGFGNMGQAIATQLKNDYQIYCFDKDITKIKEASGLELASSNLDLVNKVDTVILAVKPQDLYEVLSEIKPNVKDKLIISIAAGISTASLEKVLGIVRVIKVMPNIAIKIGAGMTCLSKGKFATEDDFNFVETLFDYMGKTIRIEEGKMDAATAVSGSGPGFCYDMSQNQNIDTNNIEEFKKFVLNNFVPSLKLAAQSVGFNSDEAELLSDATGNSCISLLIKTKLPIAELKKQITSKGGTTEAGLEVLHKGGSLKDAVKAAGKRAGELSRKER